MYHVDLKKDGQMQIDRYRHLAGRLPQVLHLLKNLRSRGFTQAQEDGILT